MNQIKIPGLIDPHVHLREPGQEEKEDFFTGSQAAIAGGFTTIIDMPNNKTPITTEDSLAQKISLAEKKTISNIGFYFGSLGDNFEEFEKVSKKVLGLKIFLNQTTGNYILDEKNLEKIFKFWPKNLPILFHAENENFEKVLKILRKNPRQIHLCHLSTSYELKKVMDAKSQNLPVTCGVTPHHLFLDKNDESTLKAFGIMKPPLQRREEVDFLWKNLKAIDCIESDHAPHTLKEKLSDNPPFGVPNLETTLPLLISAEEKGQISIDEIMRLCYENPKKIFLSNTNFSKTSSEVVVDLDQEYEIRNEDLFTKCKWSPFNGWKVKGKVIKVSLNGHPIYENQELKTQNRYAAILENINY